MASKSYRKFMATGLSAAVVASVVAPVAGAAASYPDVKEGAWYEEAVNYVTEAGYMQGTGVGFEPESKMTRAQAAQLFTNIFGIEDESLTEDFSDVSENHWFHDAVAAVLEHEIMNGVGNGKFAPEANLTRGQLAAIVVRAYGFEGAEGSEHSFSDIEGHMFEEEISILASLGLINGVGGDKFAPDAHVTRAQMAQIIYNIDNTGDVLPEVTSVSAITTTFVEVTFPKLEDAWKDATVEVVDSEGNLVEVKAMDIDAGSTTVQFDFVTPVSSNDLTGVWTVNGVEYSFTELEDVADINVAASAGNQVAVYNALNDAGIENVNVDLIANYVADIAAASPQAVTFADLQKIVDDANADAQDGETDAAKVQAVVDATNQVQLLEALQSNFDRVNPSWITGYASELVNGTGMLALAGSTGYANTVTDIQTAIDAENGTQITAAEAAANTVAKQAGVTSNIQLYTKDDVAPATTKADAIKVSQTKEAVLRVKEASTQNSVYNALVNLSKVDATTGKLNSNLAAFYFVEQQKPATQTALAAKTVASVNSSVVTASDSAALTNAVTDVTTTFTALNADNTNATKKAALKTALQKLANYTSHLTGTAKFDMTNVKDANLVAYATEFASAANTAVINNASTANAVAVKVNFVNAQADLSTSIDTVNDADASLTDVRTALTNIVIANQPLGAGTTDVDYINLSPQAKLEVAQLVKDARVANGANFTQANILTKATGVGVLRTAINDHAAELVKFNAIGDLANAATTTSTTKTALDTYAYDAYVALTASQKIAVAEQINKLTKPVGNPAVATPLNFGGADAVTTMAQANAYIDAAIAATK